MSSMWDNIELEKYGDVLQRQVPKLSGEPIPMKSFSSDLPKSCGTPWKGAYSKHGLWYKIQKGTEEDFKKLVVLSYEQDSYLLSYEDYSRFEKHYDKVQLLVAKNLRGEIMGGVLALVWKKTVQLGAYFVQEDFRHSGIGSQLFGLTIMEFEGHDYVFNSMHHLHPTLYQFGLCLQLGRKSLHYFINEPEGFPNLEVDDDLSIRNVQDLSQMEKMKLSVFLNDVTGQRPLDNMNGEDLLTIVAFRNDQCVGYGRRTEAAGGEIKRIVIGPLYAIEKKVAEGLLKELLKEFYNPEEDFDFDPDPFAIYRRQVHFFVPEVNREVPLLLEKFAGDSKKLQKHRLWYQTASNNPLPGARLARVFASDNPHFSII